MLNFELKKPVEHPFKKIMRQKGISELALSFHLGLSQPTLHLLLAGYKSMPDELEKIIEGVLESGPMEK